MATASIRKILLCFIRNLPLFPLMGEDFNWGKAPLDKFFPGTALRAVGSSEAIQNVLSN
jgi:hypothetical protein